jgi:hypothetical protein
MHKTSILKEKIRTTYSPEAYATQFHKFEQIVEGTKISMNLIAQQNALFLNTITKALSGSFMPEFVLGEQALERCIAFQKKILQMSIAQSAVVIEAILQPGNAADEVSSDFSKMVQESLTAAQKEIRDLAMNPVQPHAINM